MEFTMGKTDLRVKTKAELLKIAERFGLRGISTMNKPELIDTITRAKQRRVLPLKKQSVAMQKSAKSVKRRAVRKRAEIVVSPAKSKQKPTRKNQVEEVVTAELSAHKFDVTPAKQ